MQEESGNHQTDYNLDREQKSSAGAALRKMFRFMKGEKRNLLVAFFVMVLNAGITMLTPYLIGYIVDHFILKKQYGPLMQYSALLLGIYIVWAGTEYLQAKLMGGVGQRMLYLLRNEVFDKLQQLPVAFFNSNRSGDLISRINNDTDTVNQFFSQSLMRFMDSIFSMIGVAVFVLSIHWKLGAASLVPAVFILLFVLLVSPWVKKKNAISLKANGGLSANIQEGLQNFKTIIAFNRRDYFRDRFAQANDANYKTAVTAGIANNLFTPVFGFFSNLAQLIVLGFGIYLILNGQFTLGLLISFMSYVQFFYRPLRELAALWASFQTALAAWDRISVILSRQSNLPIAGKPGAIAGAPEAVMAFQHVSFHYPGGKKVLHDISFEMQSGKTYALVGPTGGGKSTTAALIARLYDPVEGTVLLNGSDIRTYTAEERTNAIGFILQEPFLFTGTLRENILYGNKTLHRLSDGQLLQVISDAGLGDLLARFDAGLETRLTASADSVSLGQKQLIAFIRAVLRKPQIVILDEATANIDTVTEKLLDGILDRLPATTTKIIIAHRLNTIENADEIFFVNAGELIPAGTLEHAMDMLLQHKRAS
ncbi:ABC transporter ATP-binding protein [Niabella drilacis]|uniref:ATP-binding cassette, subfamily B n=1 Tax=Niabella drilacis (strain DSM 25811 / CCM 8410 / CCUG 62505 / LMG 26954 / E90) TaxID=1285928 RepID=A0A1G7B575_NIADE|nr:ABC transporter ATP-binding protein [Niabella drilacis]SDE22181.1 ATP-binding cassette, subfamily B [Niabella drilacis]